MRVVVILIYLLLATVSGIFALPPKSPHGANHKIDCATCHVTDDWNKIKENGFNHNKTQFPLTGQHKAVNCRSCHSTLKFEDAQTECVSCHNDMHEGTTGLDCNRCHTTNSWIVTNVRQIHQQQGFPLLGAHAVTDCNLCHTSASSLRFNNIQSDCYSCHKDKYYATTTPNHVSTGFGTDCERCHTMTGREWSGKGFDHSFFPLTGGHNIDCAECHWDNFSKEENLSPECSSCHGVKNSNPLPAHKTKFLKFECNACHNISSWTSGINFRQHDSWGKIYSGEHKGEWDRCIDCHNNDAAYIANCSKCHDFSTGQLP
jgi:hypothetical protein